MKRSLIRAACAFLLGAFASVPAATAQTFPSRPITLVVPVAAGGLTDIVARLVGEEMARRLRQSVVIDNRSGAAGVLGAQTVARAGPDGHTLLVGYPGAMTVNPALMERLPYNPTVDFRPVGMIGAFTLILAVHPDVPATDLWGFLAHARANPGALNYGSGGNGTTGHLAMELLKQMTGVDLVHIPFRGAGPMQTEILAGRIAATFDSAPLILPQAAQGRLRALATSSPNEALRQPGLPTMSEAGVPGFDVTGWYALFAPAATPDEAVATLAHGLREVVSSPDVQRRLAERGVQAVAATPQELSEMVRTEAVKWQDLARRARLSY